MLQNVEFPLVITGALIAARRGPARSGRPTVVVVHEAAEVLVVLNAVRASRGG